MEPTPEGAARLLERFALAHRALGDVRRALAYERAAGSVRAAPEAVAKGSSRGQLGRLPFIGPAISARLEEYLETGRVRALDALEARLPRDFERFVEIPGIGPALALRLGTEAGVSTVDDLARAAESGRVLSVRGVTERHRRAILNALPSLRAPARRVVLLADAMVAAATVVDLLKGCPGVDRAVIAGDARRGRALVDRVKVVASARDPESARRALNAAGFPAEASAASDVFSIVPAPRGIPIEVRIVPSANFGAVLVHETGDEAHLAALAARAEARGLRLGEDRLDRAGDGALAVPSEASLYGLLGISTPPPEVRETPEAVRWTGRPLVEVDDLQGDLHVHSTASDGRAGLADMVAAAASIGRSWIAISDHAAGLPIPRGLDASALEARVNEVRSGTFPIPVLVGAEVNILADGSLGVADSALEPLDVVVGSVHSGLADPRSAITRRIVDALSTGLVDVLGHVTNRRLPRRPESDVDVERVLETVAHQGAVLEVNGSPERMDPPSPILWRARSLGIPLALDSDAHAPEEIRENARWAVVAARRGGVPAREVVTAWDFEKVRRLLDRRRRR